jgi:outer membrane receptor protein involved in Fe transport
VQHRLLLSLLMLFVVTSCGGSSKSAAPSTTASTVAPTPTTLSATTTTPTTTTEPPTTTTRPEYPKEVAVSSISDERIRSWATLSNPSIRVVAEVAPGVYASRGQGPLGSVDDYTGVFGLCADTNQFTKTHSAGATCW